MPTEPSTAEHAQCRADDWREAAVQFAEYQRAARETSQLRLGGPQSVVAPMLGLASEAGSVLNVYKRYLRDGIDFAANRSCQSSIPATRHVSASRVG